MLLFREAYQQKDVSRAVWIPCIWLFILGSRPISVWLSFSGPGGVDAMMEGSPVDRIVYLILMIAGLAVVVYRRLHWREIFTSNLLLTCFIVYCAISVAWSDFPFIAFKRWFKSLGDPLMALIILSEANPGAAIATVLRRCAYVLIPLSIVFIKYFPYLGRGYNPWSGIAYYTGVTTNKNMLGYLLLVFGLLFLCTLFTRVVATGSEKADRRTDVAIGLLFLGMVAWLIRLANSQTAVIALLVSSGVVMALGSSIVRRYFGAVAIVVDRGPSQAAIYIRYLDPCPRERGPQRDAHRSNRNLGDGLQVGSEPSGRHWLPELLARRPARERCGQRSLCSGRTRLTTAISRSTSISD